MLLQAAQERAPHRIIFYLQELSQAFQSYFTRLRTVERDAILPQAWQCEQPGWREAWDWDRTQARLAWVNAIRVVYATGLEVLGIHAPQHMQSLAHDEASDPDADDETREDNESAPDCHAREASKSG